MHKKDKKIGMSICPMVLAKHALQKIFVFYLFSWAALAAVQVQGGLRHGKIQEGEWEKPEKSLAELLLGNTNGFFVRRQQDQ